MKEKLLLMIFVSISLSLSAGKETTFVPDQIYKIKNLINPINLNKGTKSSKVFNTTMASYSTNINNFTPQYAIDFYLNSSLVASISVPSYSFPISIPQGNYMIIFRPLGDPGNFGFHVSDDNGTHPIVYGGNAVFMNVSAVQGGIGVAITL